MKIERCQSMFESYLRRVIKNLKDCPKELQRGVEYALFPGGKRLRPILCLLSYFAAGGKSKREILPFAAALEMIHSFSLVHDDLPAIDNDEMRRGKPTLHRVFGEGIAILIGDYLLTLAFELLFRSLKTREGKNQYRAIGEILKACGTEGMVAGQIMELVPPPTPNIEAAFRYYQRVCQKKTVALITASLMVGAILGGMKKEKLRFLRKGGNAFGLAFQLADDLKDNDGLVGVCGREKTMRLKRVYYRKAISSWKKLGKEFSPILTLINQILGDK
ncbi:MAG: polyprenyl synthetase family protein [candidate division WOR-3 bacterium]